jgi:ABC-type nitrate/sulfonate/bicarbonate transport system permease component
VLRSLVLERERIAPHAVSTITVAGLGFSTSVLFAFTTSLALHFSLWLERGFMPLLVASQTIPLCGSACKKDPVSGVIGVQEGPLISMV